MNSQMCTMRVERAFSNRVPVIGETGVFEEVGRAVHRIHILMDHAPHMAAFAAEDPLHAQTSRFLVDLGVQPLRHLMRGEQAEVASL